LVQKFQFEPYWDKKRQHANFRLRKGALTESKDIESKDDLWRLLANLLNLDSPKRVRTLNSRLKRVASEISIID
jgi:hypothetical protein